ncbi:MAG: NAD(P)/FAD-dependent oxidoreductase [Acidobacteria bacterium]|nr:NAD(P)/FAD-dependent oxidoreductase [Acidobacteriota bacterium]MBV9474654.1 NAD(P)/FAD-dependent oxidoreductase [Acidobacteriota bacterium]
MQCDCDIAIVGAGAAGLTAAIFATRTAPSPRVVLLDGAARIGAKILISGGGRCNVTHDVVTPDDFNGSRNAIAKVLRTFSVDATVRWFEELGVTLKREETGKLFPTTDKARTVLDALLRAASRAELRAGHRVERIERNGSHFTLHTSAGALTASRVVLSTGGCSVPKTGSDGHGYALARSLGHTIADPFPALVPLVLAEDHWMTKRSGTSADVELSVRASSGRVLARHRGALLCTHFGISGPVVLDVSRHWIAARRDDADAVLVVNFLPGETFESFERFLLAEASRNPRATLASALRGRVPERIVDALAEARPLASLTKEQRRALVRAFVEQPLPIARDRGFDFAEVTAGGVPLSEVDVATMKSRRCDGLFLCGEILDVDGNIGGYNFQWAWASGRLAGTSASTRADQLPPAARSSSSSAPAEGE